MGDIYIVQGIEQRKFRQAERVLRLYEHVVVALALLNHEALYDVPDCDYGLLCLGGLVVCGISLQGSEKHVVYQR